MSSIKTCLTEIADDLESHGNLLALLAAVQNSGLSSRAEIGLIQLYANLLNDFTDIERRLNHYRESLVRSC